MYRGDINPGDVLNFKFTTVKSSGLPTTLTALPFLSVYKDDNTAENTTAIALTVDFDGKAGQNHGKITTALDPTFYSSGSDFQVVIGSGTVDGVSVVGYGVAEFSIKHRAALLPTVDGRRLVVSPIGVVTTTSEADVMAIKAKTDNLPPDPADASDIAAAFAAVPAAVWASGTRTLTGFGTLVADIAIAVWGAAARTLTAFGFTASANIVQVGGDTATLDRLKRVTDTEVLGTVDVGSSATNIVTASLSPAASALDQFKGRIVLFDRATSTAALRGQGTRITGSSIGGILIVEALTNAPAAGDTFVIV